MSVPRFSVLLLALMTVQPVSADPGTDYVLHCRGCHGPDGDGAPGAVPSFRGQVGKFLTVAGGREYLVRVPGTSQSELDDAHVAALLNWIVRELGADPSLPDFDPYTAEEVGRLRRPPLSDVAGTRHRLVEQMQAAEKIP